MIDITTGSNNGGNSLPNCGGGFRAIPGWDPATGWGSPNFAKLKELLQRIQLQYLNVAMHACTVKGTDTFVVKTAK